MTKQTDPHKEYRKRVTEFLEHNVVAAKDQLISLDKAVATKTAIAVCKQMVDDGKLCFIHLGNHKRQRTLVCLPGTLYYLKKGGS